MKIKDHPSVLRYARSFERSCGMERDDLLQEARVAFLRAERAKEDGRYDPRESCFDTYATNAVFKGMLTLKYKNPPEKRTLCFSDWEDGGDAYMDNPGQHDRHSIPDDSPGPDHRLLLAEMIRELPSDARAVVELVLSDVPGEVMDAVLAGVKGAADKFQSYVRDALKGRLRRGDRARDAFEAMRSALSGGDGEDDWDVADRLWSAATCSPRMFEEEEEALSW